MRAGLLAVAFMLLAAAPASAAPQLVEVGRFNAPVHVASPPNDPRVFVVEQGGLVKIAGGGTFLDVTNRTNGGGEEGLLSIAFPPDYATSGRLYVFLTTTDGNALQVLEFQRSADPNLADPTTARLVLSVPHTTASNHNGGQLQFGPDGFLYVSTGDGGNTPGNAQELGSELGKILRIDARSGAAAPGNPFGTRVWSYGLRNPWRFSFDRGTGDLLIGDVGQSAREEVNWSTAASGRGSGANFGWPCREGDIAGPAPACVSATTDPAFARSSGDGFHAIVGGYVVRDPGLPTLSGRYLYGDAALGSLRSVVLPNADDRAEPLPISALSSFGQDACGRVYAASLSGPVYRIQDGAPTPCPFAAPAPVMVSVDATAPGLRVRFLRPALKNRRLRLALWCDEPCRVAVSARLRRVMRFATRHRSLAANARTVLSLKMSRRTARKLRRTIRRRGSVRVVVAASATDAAGNRAEVTRRARIKRRR
jgi:glucose/arabinose dehydrogenase